MLMSTANNIPPAKSLPSTISPKDHSRIPAERLLHHACLVQPCVDNEDACKQAPGKGLTEEEAVILKVDVVNQEEPRVRQDEEEHSIALHAIQSPASSV